MRLVRVAKTDPSLREGWGTRKGQSECDRTHALCMCLKPAPLRSKGAAPRSEKINCRGLVTRRMDSLRIELVRSAPFFAFDVSDSRFHQFFDKRCGQRLVHRELDGPFGGGEAFQFVFERFDNRCCGEQTTVVRKCSEPCQDPFVLDGRNSMADRLGSVGWRRGANRRANLVQGAAGRFRDSGEVFIHGFRGDLALGRGTSGARFCLFHGGMLQELPVRVYVPERDAAVRPSGP